MRKLCDRYLQCPVLLYADLCTLWPAVESVEVCIGGRPFLAPPAVPPRCSWQAQCLEECLEAHAEAIEAAEGSSSPA